MPGRPGAGEDMGTADPQHQPRPEAGGEGSQRAQCLSLSASPFLSLQTIGVILSNSLCQSVSVPVSASVRVSHLLFCHLSLSSSLISRVSLSVASLRSPHPISSSVSLTASLSVCLSLSLSVSEGDSPLLSPGSPRNPRASPRTQLAGKMGRGPGESQEEGHSCGFSGLVHSLAPCRPLP